MKAAGDLGMTMEMYDWSLSEISKFSLLTQDFVSNSYGGWGSKFVSNADDGVTRKTQVG